MTPILDFSTLGLSGKNSRSFESRERLFSRLIRIHRVFFETSGIFGVN